MVEPRAPVSTISFIDNYCAVYRDLFVDVRSFEAFKYLHLGMISELPRKSLPAIARAVGLPSDQVLHHCLTESPWSVIALQQRRLQLILQQLNGRAITLVIGETGDRKKGHYQLNWKYLKLNTVIPQSSVLLQFTQQSAHQ